MLFTRIPSGHAQTETYKNVDSTLYAYYRWCNNNIRDTAVLSKADTLFRLSGEKHDIRMQAVALRLPCDVIHGKAGVLSPRNDAEQLAVPRTEDPLRGDSQHARHLRRQVKAVFQHPVRQLGGVPFLPVAEIGRGACLLYTSPSPRD